MFDVWCSAPFAMIRSQTRAFELWSNGAASPYLRDHNWGAHRSERHFCLRLTCCVRSSGKLTEFLVHKGMALEPKAATR
jgi:hypothetical protein